MCACKIGSERERGENCSTKRREKNFFGFIKDWDRFLFCCLGEKLSFEVYSQLRTCLEESFKPKVWFWPAKIYCHYFDCDNSPSVLTSRFFILVNNNVTLAWALVGVSRGYIWRFKEIITSNTDKLFSQTLFSIHLPLSFLFFRLPPRQNKSPHNYTLT